mgnify:CR=1 FL=1
MNLKIMLGALLLVAFLFSACDNTPEVEPLPDLTFKVEITGSLSRNIDFTLPMGTADTRAANGSYSSQLNSLIINGLESLEWNLNLNAMTGGVRTGTFQLNQDQIDILSFVDQNVGRGFSSTSGSLTVTKAELFQGVGSTIGGADDYYIDGNFSAVLLENGAIPPATINVSGSFKGLNVKAN